MPKFEVTIRDAVTREATVVRGVVRQFTAVHPFTALAICAVAAAIVGHLL